MSFLYIQFSSIGIMELFSVGEESEKLLELKKLAKENSIKRSDDDYLNRFLVGHQQDVNSSIKALCNYESFVNRRRDTWLKIDRDRVILILASQVIDVLENNGRLDQKIVWIRLDKWDPYLFSADEILKMSGLLCEAIYTKVQKIKYIDIIMDLNNFHFQHLYALSPKFAKRMIFFLSECLPMKMLNIYVIRQPRIFYLLYAVFKPFIAERMKKAIHVCGHDFEPLIENIGRKILPAELDGLSNETSSSRWIDQVYNSKTVRDLRLSGYEFLN